MEGQDKIIKLATHIPALAKTFEISKGDVLELGTGYFSTTLLRWLCEMTGRTLYSYESDKFWFSKLAEKPAAFHKIFRINGDWNGAKIERPWGMALVDHSPDERRWFEVKRLAGFAEYIVIHNTGDEDKRFGYDKIWGLFKYRRDFNKYEPNTSVVSNFHSLDML